jgi:hypothetical protein
MARRKVRTVSYIIRESWSSVGTSLVTRVGSERRRTRVSIPDRCECLSFFHSIQIVFGAHRISYAPGLKRPGRAANNQSTSSAVKSETL